MRVATKRGTTVYAVVTQITVIVDFMPPGVKSGKYESIQKTLADVQHQLNKFLIDEEVAMEERVR